MNRVRILCSPYGLCNDELKYRGRHLITDLGIVVADSRRLPGRWRSGICRIIDKAAPELRLSQMGKLR